MQFNFRKLTIFICTPNLSIQRALHFAPIFLFTKNRLKKLSGTSMYSQKSTIWLQRTDVKHLAPTVLHLSLRAPAMYDVRVAQVEELVEGTNSSVPWYPQKRVRDSTVHGILKKDLQTLQSMISSKKTYRLYSFLLPSWWCEPLGFSPFKPMGLAQ